MLSLSIGRKLLVDAQAYPLYGDTMILRVGRISREVYERRNPTAVCKNIFHRATLLFEFTRSCRIRRNSLFIGGRYKRSASPVFIHCSYSYCLGVIIHTATLPVIS